MGNGDVVSEVYSDDVPADDYVPNDIIAISKLLHDAGERAKELAEPKSISFAPAD
jgi:hypothetical protein